MNALVDPFLILGKDIRVEEGATSCMNTSAGRCWEILGGFSGAVCSSSIAVYSSSTAGHNSVSDASIIGPTMAHVVDGPDERLAIMQVWRGPSLPLRKQCS